jgi:hypothetical protein
MNCTVTDSAPAPFNLQIFIVAEKPADGPSSRTTVPLPHEGGSRDVYLLEAAANSVTIPEEGMARCMRFGRPRVPEGAPASAPTRA